MIKGLKWLGLVGTVLSLFLIVISGIFSISYTQALINLLVGEFVVIAVAHSTYRISSGKQASPAAAALAIVGGVALAVTPYMFARFDPYLTIQLVCSLVIVATGVSVFADRMLGGEEGRQTGAQRIAKSRSGS